ncbi:MAG: hypothetical protein HOP14_14125 [Acidobacteria bacterium]|nr:hypothetical protein [Acidobacteriota bacterium]
MWAEVERILRQAMTQISVSIASFLPGLLVAIVLMLITLGFAFVVRAVLVRGLRGLEFDRRAEQWGLTAPAGWPAPMSPTTAVARLAFWLSVLLGLLLSLTALNASLPSRLALTIFEYVPHLLAAIAILIVGTAGAQFLARSALIGAVNMHLQSARLLSLAVKWLVLLVAIAIALDHLGLGGSVLPVAFAILFGGVVFAAALAVGLGARDAVSHAIDRQLHEPPPEQNVSHI